MASDHQPAPGKGGRDIHHPCAAIVPRTGTRRPPREPAGNPPRVRIAFWAYLAIYLPRALSKRTSPPHYPPEAGITAVSNPEPCPWVPARARSTHPPIEHLRGRRVLRGQPGEPSPAMPTAPVDGDAPRAAQCRPHTGKTPEPSFGGTAGQRASLSRTGIPAAAAAQWAGRGGERRRQRAWEPPPGEGTTYESLSRSLLLFYY